MSKFSRLTCVLLVSGAALLAQSTIPAVQRTTGMVGLTEGQTARLNLLNPGVLPPATGVPCTANVTFLDASGTALKSAMVTVAPGRSVGVELNSQADLNLAVADRREVRAVFTVPGAPPTAANSPRVAACKLIPTLEIFDSLTGRTSVAIGRAVAVPAAD